ncbi:glycosyltransferase family protein [Pedobacter glucosidilyticus]|uniref:glycosyltransferase family protein n=1 Tax=Pedobacter glucosidilyticus TaxID=1122941 RepID=UPI0003FFDB13|nr:glycosyltransferase [Pedobacter glucosidilyticus]
MKIVILASLTPDTTANYLIRAFKNCGDETFVISDIKNPLADCLVKGAPDIPKLLKEKGLEPDFILFIEGGSMRLFPKNIENTNCKTVWYGIDTHMDYNKHLAIGKVFDITMVAQKQYIESLRKDGLSNIFWLPLAYESAIRNDSKDKKFLISYVGSNNSHLHPDRHRMIELIKKRYSEIFFGKAMPDEMRDIYASSKLVFNKSVNNDINMRYFEAMGEGAVLLTDRAVNNGAEELFQEGKHYFIYDNDDHLITLIDNLSKSQDLVKEVGGNARELILKEHTYIHRALKVKDIVTNCSTNRKVSPFSYVEIFLRLDMLVEGIEAIILILGQLKTRRLNSILKYILIIFLKLNLRLWQHTLFLFKKL